MRCIIGAVATAIALSWAGASLAQGVPRDFWGAPAVPEAPSARGDISVEETQTLLLLIGFYYGEIDGRNSDDLRGAVERFQASLGEARDGRLTPDQVATLRTRADRAKRQADFQVVHDDWTGISAPLPMGYVSAAELSPLQEEFTEISFPARGSSGFSVDFQRLEGISLSARQIYQQLLAAFRKNEDNTHVDGKQNGEYFLIDYLNGGKHHVLIYQTRGGEARGVRLSYPVSRANIFAPVRQRIFSEIRHFDTAGYDLRGRVERVRRGEIPGYRELPDWARTMRGSGSGSIVTWQGHILTNHHVVDGCDRLTVNGNPALLLGVDIVNDLALLRSDFFARRGPVRFRAQDARLGEDVIVVGYPVFIQSRALNVTTGVVSARSGLRGDRRSIQITAPVQPGNSGGPVLDRSGQQIAVVVAKASSGFQIEGNVENMAWVIRGDIAMDFLREHGVEPLLGDDDPGEGDTVMTAADMAKRFTIRVECHPPAKE
ncbi:MAG: serine protease [Pseudomonadota bacterium]|nr:serine protease [Pseudomonadota bacterium]MEE3101764.1 serine protease [Pseudomonadota bacterium]